MKKWITCLMILLVVGMVSANMYINESFYSDGDIYANININADGGVNLSIDGTGNNTGSVYITDETNVYNTYKSGGGSRGDDWEEVFQHLSTIFMLYSKDEGWAQMDPVTLKEREEWVLRYVMDHYFVPRTEYDQDLANLQSQILYLHFEVKAVQAMLNKANLCNARLQIALEYNMTSVACGNTTYYNMYEGDMVGLEVVK